MKSPSGRRRKARAPRRTAPPRILGLAVLLVAASLVAGYLALTRADNTEPTASSGTRGNTPKGSAGQSQEEPWDGKTKILGDGSTSYTGPQTGELKAVPLKPGEKPPQFVVFSWDGALAGDDELFQHYRKMAKEYDAHMTFFLTGIYLLPKSKRDLYAPPQHKKGAAAISFPTDEHIRTTLEQLGKAWQEGNEIGTHFNGHFCGAKGGGDWSVEEWKSEIDQFYAMVENWKTNTGFKDIAPLPFDFKKEVTGGRAPCLEGQANLLKAAKGYGWRYDASSAGDFQIWPTKKNGMWDFPLQALPYDGGDYQGLSMDFNFLANQSDGQVDGDPARYPEWEKETTDAYMAGFNRVYYGSRAPLFIGNHFENWNGGIYMKSVDEVIKNVCTKKDVKCVSFRELSDWLDVQKPETLQTLRTLDPAQSTDWSTVVK
ncbi:lipoprotein [Streptomyces griseus]|uniref:lipoprotein n=1 Tax=Streptomyces griseus TaxID=1911 RepID=UPI0005690F53|nr:lipoprotein [Streptomyces griseus]